MTTSIKSMVATFMLMSIILVVVSFTHSHTKQQVLRIGMNDWLGYQGLFWMQERYAPPGRFDLIELPNNTEAARLLHNGAVDIACLTLDEVIRLSRYSDEIAVIAVLDYSDGADALVVQQGIASLEDLRGRRIGYEHNALGDYMLQRLLEYARLSPDEVNATPLDIRLHRSHFMQKRIDAVLTFEPTLSQLLQNGGVTLFDSAMIPGEIVDLLVTRKAVIEKHPEALRSLVGAWFRAAKDITERRPPAMTYMAGLLQSDPETLGRSLEGIAFPTKNESKTLLSGKEFETTLQKISAILESIEESNASQPPLNLTAKDTFEILY